MTEDAARGGLEWLETHRGKPLTADWYIERDAEYLTKLAEQGIDPDALEKVEPMPVEVKPAAWREGAWLVIYNPSFTRILDGRDIAGARVEHDEQRLVIEYGRRRFVLEERA
jgi:hypothetical protein